MSKRLADCQRVIGYHFANPKLLEIALTHSSVRTPDRECNERQEFLGDSVLGLAITEELYKRLPDQQEGELTRIKSAVVSRGALYRVSTRMGLVRFVEVAKGVGRREELPVSLTANLVESIIGAIYLDAGFFPAREFILRNLGPEVEDVMNDRVAKNYKSLLQHEAQQILGATPIYRTLEEEGPDHRKAFVVAAVIRGTEYGRASGINKKEAEQEAARHALDAITSRGRGRRRRSDGRGEERRTEERRPDDRREPARYEGARSEGGRGDGGRGDAGRGDAGRGDAGRDLRPRDRDAVRALGKQTADDDAWRAWAEAPAGSAPPSGSPRPAPGARSEPSGPYVVGPEPEEAYHDDVGGRAAGHGPPPPGAGRASREADEGHPPPRVPHGGGERARIGAEAEGVGTTSEPERAGPEAVTPMGAEADGDGPRGRRRRGRRGGRRRHGEGPGDEARPAGDQPMTSEGPPTTPHIGEEADPRDVRDDATRVAPTEAPSAPAAPERAPRRSGPRERTGEEPRSGRGRGRAAGGGGGRSSGRRSPAVAPEHDETAAPRSSEVPAEAPTGAPARELSREYEEPAPEAKAPPKRRPAAKEASPGRRGASAPAAAPESAPSAPASPASSFGHGVAGGDSPVPLTRVEREVTTVRGAPAVKKAPAAAPEKPPTGGFGVGL